MRFPHLVAATLTGVPGLVSADPSSSSSCTTTTSTLTSSSTVSVTLPNTNNPWSSSISTANFTITDTVTTYSTTSTPLVIITGGNSTFSVSPTSTTPATVSSNVAAAGEGLAGDSSMLGLVVFFALSLCLL
ncbi:hypothetical protein M406DRAFT_356042 [Cryphonectria parasitica EP155]|uniref:Uncharacterized protein n=1 Tax=Cryphonectria parasitica (strain ATCC 38755 / EP155) TaxID=660469 RepID=A0A9P5CP32_CRYP1|nr:uncharacterized protein M406DRAFT_356042 [Cryphonectria parasitica EP155]KAF3765753.1 hypothetical protein M406DRAFT_356042 [Cryphonectria parasitica EP155]